ncbi:MAG: hypothetical protein WC972_02955 [Trueperaceae bacterium]
MAQTKAIQTRYKGYHFRSRLEARWAVMLDHLGLEWEYEVEGFEFPNGVKYLPDFWLPSSNVFLEIKRGNLSYDENELAASKAESLAVYEGFPVLLAQGVPGDALFEWYARDRRGSHMPHDRFVALDLDDDTGLPVVWSAEHEPIFHDAIFDAWGRDHYFTSYSDGFFASTYLVCHPEHHALEARRRKELVGVAGPQDLPLSGLATAAVAAARSARFEFGESGAS